MPATTRPSDTTPIGASSPQLFHSAHGFTIEGGRGPTFNVYPSIETSTYPHPPIAPSTSNVDRMPDRAAGSTPFVESDVYAQLLLPCRQGYPLWEPKTYNEHLPEVYKKVGVHLGDVGLLTRLGGFDYLFNVCHEADHELNRGRVPVDFIPISNYIADRDINQHEFPIGSHFLSDATQIRRHKIQIENIHHGPMNQFEFDLRDKFGGGRAYSSTTSEGALLILPEGARRLDYLHSKPLLDYALDHAASWFTHASEALGRITENRLYVITGVHKARAWGMAAFRNANPQDVALEFVPKYSGENSTGFPEYDFRTCDSAVAANGADDTYRQQSGSVFLRGWRISMRKRYFRKPAPKHINIQDENFQPDHSFSDSPMNKTRRIWPGSRARQARSDSRYSSQHSSTHPNQQDSQDQLDDDILGLDHTPDTQIYHPLNAVNDWLLSSLNTPNTSNTESQIDIAISHDNVWLECLRDDDKVMPDDQELLCRVRASHIEYGTTSKGHRYACLSTIQDPRVFPNQSSIRVSSLSVQVGTQRVHEEHQVSNSITQSKLAEPDSTKTTSFSETPSKGGNKSSSRRTNILDIVERFN